MVTDSELARIARYVFGECSPSQAPGDEAWIDASPERRAARAALEAIRAAAPPSEPHWDSDRAWARLRRAMGTTGTIGARDATGADRDREGTGPGRRPFPAPSRHASGRMWGLRIAPAGIAATVLVGAAIGTGIRLASLRHPPRPEMRELITAAGQRVTLRLGDGTRISLGPASRLRYPTQFQRGPRLVELEGEGYFEVHHDPANPLVVRTPRSETRDVGTTFVVRDYVADSEPRVSVAEGRVAMRAREQGAAGRQRRPATLLTRGQVAVLAPDGSIGVRSDPDLGPETAWANGELVFRHARLRDVLPELSRWYDADLRLADPALGDLQVTTAFKDESLVDALDALAAALGLVVDREGSAFILRRERTVQLLPPVGDPRITPTLRASGEDPHAV